MKQIFRIDHPSNEASTLLGVQNRDLLYSRGWETAFWTVSDEKDATDAIVVVGRDDRGEWSVEEVRINRSKRSSRKKTEDCECIARAGSWIYVVGSHAGGKEGPLEPSRHFVMRFNEALVRMNGRLEVEGDVAREPFLLHRLVNDALSSLGIELLEPGEEQRSTIDRTIDRGEKKKKRWRGDVREGDIPINVEGVTFLHGGHMLLGLRHPVTAEGHPIVVEIEGIDRLFDGGEPTVSGVRIVANVGSRKEPAGVRELDCNNELLHLISGNLESGRKNTAVTSDHPEAARASIEHWIVPLTSSTDPVTPVYGQLLRRFDGTRSIEGMALDGDRVWYVYDDEQIVLEVDDAKRPE